MSIAAALESWLGPIEPEVVAELERAAELMTIAPGDVVTREGDEARACFLVLGGRLSLPGRCVGAAEVLAGGTYRQTVTALRETRVARLRGLEAIFSRHPRAALGLARSLAKPPQAAPAPAHWALLLLGDSPRLAEAARKLVAALGATLHVTRKTRPDLDPAWLEAEARAHHHVVLELDHEPNAWSRLALDHVDHVVSLAEAGASPVPAELEAGLRSRPRTLVLIHPDRRHRPSGTSRWLNERPGARHIHVAADTPQDFERAARVLTGKSIAVALSGGASRGFAHIGGIRALHEAGVPIDAFGGTSTGAAMGAQAAMGLGFDEMVEMNRRIFSLKPFREYTLPVFSLIGGTRVDRGLQEAYGELDLEDLWLPHLVVSANLTAGGIYVHERGPVWRAVRASCSLPAVAVPVVEDGQLLVDGGLMNNLPVDLLRERGAGRVIAFNATGTGGAIGGPTASAFPSPWKGLLQRLKPGAGAGVELPGLLDILMRSIQLASDGHARAMAELADFHIRYPVEQFGLFETERCAEIAQAGYAYAKPIVDGWKLKDR